MSVDDDYVAGLLFAKCADRQNEDDEDSQGEKGHENKRDEPMDKAGAGDQSAKLNEKDATTEDGKQDAFRAAAATGGSDEGPPGEVEQHASDFENGNLETTLAVAFEGESTCDEQGNDGDENE